MNVEKTDTKLIILLQTITIGVTRTMNQSEFLAITCNLLRAWETLHIQGAIGFGFASFPLVEKLT